MPHTRSALALIGAILFTAGQLTAATMPDTLADGFQHPPDSAKPRTWWHWVSGYVSKEGITADLEAMKRIGVGGAQAFSVNQGPQAPKPVLYMTPEWRAMMRHAVDESTRLNLELTITNCEGWSESGGPWIKPENSMQKIVWSQAVTHGPGPVDITLDRPEANLGYYKDITILAFPKTPGDDIDLAILKPTVTTSSGDIDSDKLSDGDPKTTVTISPEHKSGPVFIQYTFNHPIRCGSVVITPVSPGIKGDVQISADGKNFLTVGTFSAGAKPKPSQAVIFDPADVRAVRLYVPKTSASKPWSIGEISIAGPRVPDFLARSGMESKLAFIPMPNNISADSLIPTESIQNLTNMMDSTGKLTWTAPPGDWTILRIGSTTTGITNHPAMDQTRGLECNKLSRSAVVTQFNNTVGKIAADAGDQAGKGLKMVLFDSWEAGCENWTPEMREEFKNLRGYDPEPWLPALTGRYVATPEQTERFLWDYRRTLADLLADNHYGLYRDLCHQDHLQLTAEAVGINMPTVADQLQCKGRTDVPMGEFWVDRTPRDGDPKEAASAAHIYGQNIAAAEAYTARPDAAQWRNDPASLKALGDRMFCLGINRFVFHRYAMQPFLDRAPGITMGPWGINFERTNTWWDQGKAWIDYISRCEYLLQQGHFVADVCYYYGEGAPVTVQIDKLTPTIPAGYDFDACNKEILLSRMTVNHHMLTLPSGMSYRVLVLPDTDKMTPEVARKIRDLVAAGATVIGPRPMTSPSLTGYPDCDAEVAKISQEVWGDCDGRQVTERRFGKGRIIWGQKLEDVLRVSPDFSTPDPDVNYIHRDDHGTDIYFVSNQQQAGRILDCSFRVTGKVPELWFPDTGKIEHPAVWHEHDHQTTLPLSLQPVGSVFVIFRDPIAIQHGLAAIKLDGKNIDIPTPMPKSHDTLEIRSATYGDLSSSKHRDVTAALSSEIKDGHLSISANNALLGRDPAPLVHKQLRVDYTLNGQPASITLPEGHELDLPPHNTPVPLNSIATVSDHSDGSFTLTAYQGGHYDLIGNDGTSHKITVNSFSPTLPIEGPWELRFQPGRLAPESIQLDTLSSWTDQSQDGVKYFSGTATYIKDFDLPASALRSDQHISINLGTVKNLAQVSVNGHDQGILWKTPFATDITDSLHPGKNHLEIRITNLWPNRLIGDQFLPESQRVTWTTYNPYKKDSPLLPSGLLGPVQLEFSKTIDVNTMKKN
ncbi:MAG TPA: glycosyl hydrolase [Tepidisphaeraceae bacterium]|jgi:hypothetical protein|nr:glycosyl hydrolase [Tepidisphaeraceae bacterium]